MVRSDPQPVSAAPAAPGADAFIPPQEESFGQGEYLPHGGHPPDRGYIPDGAYPERGYYPDAEYYAGGEYYPDGEYYPEHWERQPVSRLAVAALVSGLLALLPLALGFGI